MNRRKRKGMLLLAMLLILGSGGYLLWNYYNQTRSERIYGELAAGVASANEPLRIDTETEEEYVSPIDFEALWSVNEDVVAWLRVPDTAIDYPVLHDPESNSTYLYTDIEGNHSPSGSIYLDCDNEADFSDLHNVIYGHHMKDGTMFKDVMKFREQEFLEAHQTAYIYLPDREIVMRPYACLYTDSSGIRRKTKFDSEEEFRAYTAEMTKNSSAYVIPDQEIGRLFSLVTCSYEFDDARTILYCYEIEE